jgi:hypothetical protein
MSTPNIQPVLDEYFKLVEQFAGGPWPISLLELLKALKDYDPDQFFDQFEKGEIRRKQECGGASYGT